MTTLLPNPSNRLPITVSQLDRYLRGTATAEDRAIVQAWLSAYPEARRFVEHVTLPAAEDDLESAWAAVMERTVGSASGSSVVADRKPEIPTPVQPIPVPTPAAPQSRPALQAAWMTLAASCVAFMLVALGWLSGNSRANKEVASTRSIYTTPNGQRGNITLPDGSTVVLNAGSRLEVPTNFAQGNRTLNLSGEALFTVTHKHGTPFTVVAGHSVTRVLGTRFVVRHFVSDSTAVVAVQDGKVAVHSTVLAANQELVLGINHRMTIRAAVPSRFSFERGILSVDGTRLGDAIPDLNRWFDADVQLGDATLASFRLEGDYGTGSVGTLAEILELTFNLRVVRHGRVLILYPRESNR